MGCVMLEISKTILYSNDLFGIYFIIIIIIKKIYIIILNKDK